MRSQEPQPLIAYINSMQYISILVALYSIYIYIFKCSI